MTHTVYSHEKSEYSTIALYSTYTEQKHLLVLQLSLKKNTFTRAIESR